MKRHENYRLHRGTSKLTVALIGLFLYIIAILIFKSIGGIASAKSYSYVYGVLVFLLTSVAIVMYIWRNFRNDSTMSIKHFISFMGLMLIPILIMTMLTFIIMLKGGSTSDSFASSWNTLTFIVAPTLYFYYPFGVLMELTGMGIVPYMLICLVIIVGLMLIGYFMGAGNRTYVAEKELVRKQQEENFADQQSKRAINAAVRMEERKKQQQTESATITDIQNESRQDILSDIEQPAVIKTEAISKITDEMIEEAIRQKKIKTLEEKKVQVAAPAEKKQAQVTAPTEKKKAVTHREPTPEELFGTEVYEPPKDPTSTENLSKELEIIRRKMQQRGK